MMRPIVPYAAIALLAVPLCGCSAFRAARPAPQPLQVVAMPDRLAVETIPFRTGVSSATVEKLARRQGCTGGQGAALVTEPGPVEAYRMRCDNGQVFVARCELRQCRQMAR